MGTFAAPIGQQVVEIIDALSRRAKMVYVGRASSVF
jgi:hypothetical protein